jgi:small-conductance mechanosensitive channel
MSATEQSNQGFFGFLDLPTVATLVAIAVAAVVAERLITRYLSRVGKRLKLEPYVINNLSLTFRILILIIALVAITVIGRLPPEWILSLSALIGAAVGFASTKTLGNFLAGLFLLAARPFRVGDYVRIGTVEGIVQELTINYTKVLTIGNNTVSISNLQILDRDITNFCQKSEDRMETYCYTFEIGFDHSVSQDKVARIFAEVFERYAHLFPQRPSYVLARSGAFERIYMVYLYVQNPEDIFEYRPQIAEEVFKRWDMERAAAKSSATESS